MEAWSLAVLSQFSAGQSWVWFLSEICFSVAQRACSQGGGTVCSVLPGQTPESDCSGMTSKAAILYFSLALGCCCSFSGGHTASTFARRISTCTPGPFLHKNCSSSKWNLLKKGSCVSAYGWDKTPADVQPFPCLGLRLARVDANCHRAAAASITESASKTWCSSLWHWWREHEHVIY